MNDRSAYLLQLLQKFGAPLAGSVVHFSSGNETEDAAAMASLMSDCIKVSIALSQAMNLRPTDGDANAIRAALATLAAELMADSYRQSGRMPTETERTKLTKLLESVIVFADHFTPAQEHAARLMTLDKTAPFFDAAQSNLYAMQAVLPVISAVADFSFGQSETKLVQDLCEKLKAKGKTMAERMLAPSDAMAELVMLQTLSHVYAQAHRRATKEMEAGNSTVTLETVWTRFETMAAMVEAVMGAFGSSETATATGGSGGGQKPALQTMETPESATPPRASTAAPAQTVTSSTGGSPMAFFKKK